jgi:putative transposase
MPWNETTAVDERCRFVMTYFSGAMTMSELCASYGISRPTGYKWVKRYAAQGAAGLYERSRAPLNCAHRMAACTAEWLLADRREHPDWGAVKIVKRFSERHPKRHAPAPSAVSALFKRHGLIEPRKRRQRSPSRGCRATAASEPNALWTMDFKGQFRTGDHRYCYPLTVMDALSRYLLACRGGLDTSAAWVMRYIDELFREYGLPWAVHSDNGSPFASSNSLGGLSRLSVHWVKLGIRIERSRPACPQDNPAHERMHRTLKASTARPPASHLRAQQRRFDHFRHEYNDERPHEALELQPPDRVYRSSPRPYPSRIPEPEYAGHFERRRVGAHGCIKWNGRCVFIGAPLSGEYLGLEEVDEALWAIYFYDHQLARLDEREGKLIKVPL